MCRRVCRVKKRVLGERRYTVFVDQISPNANAQSVGDVLTACKSKFIQHYRYNNTETQHKQLNLNYKTRMSTSLLTTQSQAWGFKTSLSTLLNFRAL